MGDKIMKLAIKIFEVAGILLLIISSLIVSLNSIIATNKEPGMIVFAILLFIDALCLLTANILLTKYIEKIEENLSPKIKTRDDVKREVDKSLKQKL